MTPDLDGFVVAIAGAGGSAGRATVRHLIDRGAAVVAADADQARLDAVVESVPGAARSRVSTDVVDLLDPASTRDWVARIEQRHGRLDGMVHLVGGWRGSSTFEDTSLTHWDALEPLLVKTAMHTSLASSEALMRSGRGRFLLVSAAGAASPTAGNAAYAAAKAAAEAWTLALADAFGRSAPDSGAPPAETGNGTPPAAACILVVKALVDESMRAANPQRAFIGFTPVEELAEAIGSSWARSASETNGTRWWMTEQP